MRRTRFDDWPCPIARVTDLFGDWWTPLVLRDAFAGIKRFEDFQTNLGIPRAVLTARLTRLVDEGLLEKRRYEDKPPRDEYRLTAKGVAAWDILAAMWRYGEDWCWPDDTQPKIELRNIETGQRIRPQVIDGTTGEPLDLRATRIKRRR